MFPEHFSTPVKLFGVLISTSVTAFTPLVAKLPDCFPELEKWSGLIAVFFGILATAGIAVGQWLKNIKSWQDIKDTERRNLQEIQRKNEEAVCLNRRLTGICPTIRHHSDLGHVDGEPSHDIHRPDHS